MREIFFPLRSIAVVAGIIWCTMQNLISAIRVIQGNKKMKNGGMEKKTKRHNNHDNVQFTSV